MARFVEIGGKRRPVSFSFEALLDYEERTGRLSIPDIIRSQDPGQVSIVVLVDLLYSAFCAGYAEEGLEVDFSKKECARWFRNIGEAMRIINLMTQDLEANEDADAGNGAAGPAKKKPAPNRAE